MLQAYTYMLSPSHGWPLLALNRILMAWLATLNTTIQHISLSRPCPPLPSREYLVGQTEGPKRLQGPQTKDGEGI